MKKSITKFGIALFLAAIIFNGCKGKDGAPGATGPAGSNGTDGNAIIHLTLTIHSTDWVWNSIYNQWFFNYYTTVNSQSAVNCYVLSGNGEEAMPYYNQSDGTTLSFADNLYSNPGFIKFEYYNLTASLSRPLSDKLIYIVCIPPHMMIQHPEVNLKNYQEVKKVFNLK